MVTVLPLQRAELGGQFHFSPELMVQFVKFCLVAFNITPNVIRISLN